MLRSAMISLLALIVLTGGFLIYWHMQPPPSSPDVATTQPVTTNSPGDATQMKIGPGHTAWADSYTDGRLSSQFKADEYTPMNEAGKFKVVHPVWVFYLSDGQYLLVKGDEGIIHVDTGGAADKSSMESNVPQSPDNGVLQHVQIELYPSKQAEKPTLWLSTNNIAFDNETLRLYTQSFVDSNGAGIPGDQVPVTVRGDDYEFDGKGLTLHWNDRDHRLQLMEIAHGRRLEIKNPSKMSMPMTTQPSPSGMRLTSGLPVLAAVLPGAQPATQPAEVLYRAIFHDDVQVLQGDRQMAKADTMTVDFLPAKQKAATATEKPPTTTEPFEPEPGVPTAAQKIANGGIAQPTSELTTKPAVEPVTVYWTGKLHITPLETPPMMPLIPGQSVVRLEGSPVELTPEGAIVHAAAVLYRSADGAAQLQNSTAFPRVDLKRDDGPTFTADSLSYDPATSLATIVGPGELHTPTDDKKGEMSATWAGKGFLHVVGRINDHNSFIDHVELYDNVIIDHPKLSLNAQELALDLQKQQVPGEDGKSSEEVKRVTATGDAVCRLKDPGNPPKGIDGDKLVLETAPGPDGKPTPHTIVADGKVHAFDPQQELRAGHLEAVLVPDTTKQTGDDQAMNIDSMYASSAVHAVLKNGSTSDSDQLRMKTVDGHHQVELRGGATPAILTNPQHSTLTGQVIDLSPDQDQQAIVVDGPGNARVMPKASTTQPAHPADIAWTGGLNGNGAANTLDVNGNVTGHTIDAKSNVDTLTCDSARVDLLDSKSTTKPTDIDLSSNKPPPFKKLTLTGNVDLKSLLTAPDGTLLLRRELQTTKLIHDAIKGRTTVPVPGTIWMEDHRKPATTAPTDTATPGNNRGTMAINWANYLIYDQPTNRITFDRDVHAVFLQDAQNAAPMKLTCQRLIADLKTIPATPTASAKTQLQHVHAEGAVDFISKTMHFTSHTVDYDPTTFLMTARGSPEEQVIVYDDQSGSSSTFEEVIYNVQTQQPEIMKRGEGEMRH